LNTGVEEINVKQETSGVSHPFLSGEEQSANYMNRNKPTIYSTFQNYCQSVQQ
jgi:hypothetical protein